MRYLILFLFLIISIASSQAQETDADTVSFESNGYSETDDSEEVVVHSQVKPEDLTNTKDYKNETIPVAKFDKTKWKEVIGKTTFEEKVEEKKEEPKPDVDSDSGIDLSNTRLAALLSSLYSWLPYISYVVIICLIGFIIYFFVRNTSLNFSKINKAPNKTNDYSEHVDNIEDLEILSDLQNALASRNYKLAVRLHFLDLLKSLNDQGKIAWKKDKTNRDYLGELFNQNFYFTDIRKLTLAYETVWYGEHTFHDDLFRLLFKDFETLQSKIKTVS